MFSMEDSSLLFFSRYKNIKFFLLKLKIYQFSWLQLKFPSFCNTCEQIFVFPIIILGGILCLY